MNLPIPTATNAITTNKTIRLLLEIGGLITVVSLGLIVLLSVFTNNQVQLYLTNRQLISATQANNSDLANTLNFLEQQKQRNDTVVQALPTQTNLPDFVSELELVAAQRANDAQLEITTSSAQGSAGGKFITFILRMTTDYPNLELFLTESEKLRYLVEYTNIKMERLDLQSPVWNITITAKVYVSDAF